MGIRDLFKPHPDNFVNRLLEQASLTLRGMELLKAYMEKPSASVDEQITATEREADEVRHMLIDELLRTFVTPIDREDISALSRAIDDMLDYAYTTVDEMEILKVKPTSEMQHIASLLYDGACEIHLAVQRLQDNHPGVASDHARRAKASENRVEQAYREALADLFSSPKNVDDVMKMLKKREVYRHLSNAADRGDEAANIIDDIVVKMT
jgi:predicted phosphate transport protein (TIGR00153 family)